MPYDIVIAGGGAGGLELAARLGRRFGRREGPRRVLLVDRSIFHLWKPSLHEVAAGTLDAHQEGLSYLVLARRNHFSFLFGDVSALEPEAKRLCLSKSRGPDGAVLICPRTLSFRRLVLATGSGSNLFNTPGAAEHVFLLEDVADAEAFHRRLTAAFLSSAYAGPGNLAIAIVGAGATGVELSTELLEGHAALSEALDTTQRFHLRVILIEAASRILGGLRPEVAEKAARALRERGVEVITDGQVTRVLAEGLETSRGFVPADLVVWAAGVQAGEGNRSFGLATGRLNQFIVDDRLRTSGTDIYAIGDCAEAPGPGGRPVPARAQAAAQQARYLARALAGSEKPGSLCLSRPRLAGLSWDRSRRRLAHGRSRRDEFPHRRTDRSMGLYGPASGTPSSRRWVAANPASGSVTFVSTPHYRPPQTSLRATKSSGCQGQ